MATDTTGISTETTTAREGDVERANLTQGATQVQLPQGENVVRIQVTPGETIQLPFPQDAMVARLDDGNGNLAVKVGDITVILQGYVAATGEADVNLIDVNGQSIDVAAVVAATDPNLDIETAAGPGAGDQGTGPDNNGGVFSPFDPLAGIGGLNGIGGLDPTALEYRLIEREGEVFEEDEEEETDTVPTLVGLTPGTAVNEDDLEGGRGNESSAAKAFEEKPDHIVLDLQQALGGMSTWWGNAVDRGNDPFDTDDHEEGSQNPGLEDNNNGLDQDREPLTSTAVASVNFFGDVPGHLSFTNAGSTPVLDQLQAMNLTSHSLAIQYLILPRVDGGNPDNSHGETLVAYVIETHDEGESTWQSASIIFTIALREYEGTDPVSDFNIDFTIYAQIDNVPGVADADGNILDALDIDVPFFMVDSDGSVTPAPDGALVFTDIDDVPALGSLETEWTDLDPSEQGWNYVELPIGKNPTDTDIEHDETPGHENQGEDIALPNDLVNAALTAAGWSDLSPMGAAGTEIDVSFGADGRAGIGGEWVWTEQGYVKTPYSGNKEAGETVFSGDAPGTYATAYQFFVGSADAPLTEGKTNWTITEGGEVLAVLAKQIDAHTIIGYAENDGVEIPVFVLRIDPQTGETVLVQMHQVNHDDDTSGNDVLAGLQIFAPGEEPSDVVFQHDFDNLTGWSTIAGGNAQIVGDVGTVDPQPNPTGQALLVGEGADAASIETFLGLAAGALAAAADDKNDANGVEEPTEGSAIKQQIDVHAGDHLTVRFNFLENESDSGEGGLATDWQDFAFIVIGSEVIRLANVGEAGTATSNSYGSFTWSEESGYLVFTFDFTVDGPIQLGFGVMNEGDASMDPGLLIDQVVITRENQGEGVIVRATDYDGDFVETPLYVTIRDDGPSLTAKERLAAELTLDESTGADAGDANADDEINVALPAILTSGYPDVLGAATDATDVLFANVTYGADGPGSVLYKLTDADGNTYADGTKTGLFATKGGAEIELFTKENGVIEGRIGGAEGEVAFALHIDATDGTVSMAQYLALNHGGDADHDQAANPVSFDFDLHVTLTVTDADGDTASATSDQPIDIAFEDDGPKISVVDDTRVEIILDESVGQDPDDLNATDDDAAETGAIGTKTGSVIGLFTGIDFGSDGAKDGIATPQYKLVLKDVGGAETSIGTTVVPTNLSAVGFGDIVLVSESAYQVNGYVNYNPDLEVNEIAFVVRVDPATGSLTVSQFLPIAHETDGSSNADHDDILSLLVENNGGIFVSATVTDGDNDKMTVEAPAALHIEFEDDGPKLLGIQNGDGATVTKFSIDEDNISGGQPGGPGDDAGAASADFTVTVDFGTDGKAAAAFAFTGDWSATVNGQDFTDIAAAGGQPMVITVLQSDFNGYPAGTLVGWYGPAENDTAYWAFTVTMDPVTGQGTFSLHHPINHPEQDDSTTEGVTEAAFEDNIVFSFGVRATDGDGDYVDTNLVIDIDDDSPVAANDTGGSYVETTKTDLGTVEEFLLANDLPGADGLKNNLVINGGGIGSQGGLLEIINGHVWYTAPNVQDDATETFSYTITDRDGDTSTANVTFSVTDRGGGTASVTLGLTSLGDFEDGKGAVGDQPAADAADSRLSLPFQLKITPTDGGDTVDSVVISGIPSGAEASFGGLVLPVSGGSISITRGDDGGIYDAFLDALLTGAQLDVKLAEHDDRDVTLTMNAVVDGVAVTPDDASAIVDAVAAQPALTDPSDQSKPEATPISTVFTVNTTATFADFGDGSEKQYVLIKIPADGWLIDSVEIAGSPATQIPGGLASHPGYMAFDVTDVADSGSGSVPVTIIVAGPANVASTTIENLEIKSLAVDTPTDNEITTANNSAEATQTVALTITDRTGGEDLVTFVGEGLGGYEDDEATSPGQTDVDEPSDQQLSLTFNLKATATDPGDSVDSVDITGIPSGATAVWSGSGFTLTFGPGDHTVNAGSGGTESAPGARAAFLADLIDGNGANLTVTLAEHDSRDVTIGMKSTIGGTATDGDDALAIVDAVAAQPGFTGTVPGSQSLAEAGGATTSFNIQTHVAFADTADGNEKQYILIKIPGDGWSIPLVIGNGIDTFFNAASPTAIQLDGADIGHPGYIAIDVTDIAGPAAFNLVVFVNGPANVPPAGDSQTIEIKALAIDAVEGSDITPDNNQASTTQSVTLTVTDSKPTINSAQTTIRVDEDGLTGGNTGSADDAIGDDTTTDSKTFIGQFDYTAGKDAITGITLGTAGGLTGLETLDGLAVKTIWDSASKTLTGFADADNDGQMDDGERPVFTLVVTDVAGGDYTFTLNEPLKHENSEAEGDNYEDDLSFEISVKVTDADGSESETASVTVNIDDDAPTVTKVNYSAALGDPDAPVGGDNPYPWDHSLSIGRVDEDWIFFGNEDKDGANTNGDEIGSNVVTGVITHSVGADGLKSMGFVVGEQNADIPGLLRAYDNAQVKLHWNDSKTQLIGFVGEDSGWGDEDNQVFVMTLAVPSGGFTFTLMQPVEHTAAVTLESDKILDFPVTIIDNDDDVATATIQIAINDDRPIAIDDDFGEETATLETITLGNLLGDNGGGEDAPGADSYADKPVVGLVSPGNVITADQDGNGWTITLAGKGVIHVDVGGTVTFTANPNYDFGDGETFSFDYQFQDGDGDFDTATATFEIKNPDVPVIEAPDLYVGESMLAVSAQQPYKGSEQPGGPLTDSNSFTLPDNFIVTNAGVHNLANGVLTITQIGNQVTYSYTLTKAVDDGSPETNDGRNVVDDANQFVVNFSGPFGVTTSITLNVDIQDDSPIAYFDSDALNNGALTTDGNVITGIGTDIGAINADRVGADGAKLTAIDAQQANIPPVAVNDLTHGAGFSIVGEYGTLVIFEDGFYTYTRLNGDPFLPPVTQVSDVFDYTLTDKDGDTSTTTLTIRITDQGTTLDLPTSGEDGTKVYEAGLPAGSAETADDIPNNEDSEKTSGVITVTAPDGLAGVTIGGVFLPYSQLASGPLPTTILAAGTHSGFLTIEWFSGNSAGGQIGYSYALTTNTSGDNTTDSFPIVVHDLDGDQSSGNLVIAIVDDVPNAENDGNHVVVGLNLDATPEISFGAATGLLSNDVLGADGASISKIAFDGNDYMPVAGFITIPVDGGTLTVNAANGAWNYNQTSAIAAPKTLNFTYTLTDGDTDFDTATFSIEPKAAVKPSFAVETIKLDEDGLAGNAGNQPGNGDDDQDAGDSGEGLALPGDGRGTEAVWQQSISVDWGGDVGTLTVGFMQNSGGFVQNGSGEFLRTADGERITWSATNGVSYESITAYAEGDNSNNPVFTIHLTQTGVLTVHLYQPMQQTAGGQENNLTFPIWINATNVAGEEFKVVTVNIDDDVPTLAANEQNIAVIVDESDLDTDDSTSFSSFFTPTYGADGAGGVGNYVLGVSADGADSGLIDTATGNHIFLFLVNGQVIGKEGFDAASAEGSGATVFVVSVNNVSGEVTLDQQRAIQHPTADPNEPAFLLADNLLTLTATVVDKDGDLNTATANIGQNLVFLDDGPTANALTSVTLDDDTLTGGNPDGTGDQNPDTSGTVGSLNVDFGADGRATTGGLTGYSFTGISTTPFLSGISREPAGANAWVVKQGSVEIFKLEITDLATGAYKITQLNPLQHPAGADENDVTFRVSLTIRDNDGDTTIADIDVTIDDDTPVANDDGLLDTVDDNAVNVTIGTVAELLDNDEYGADGKAATGDIVIGGGSLGGTVSIQGGNLVYTSGKNVTPGTEEIETFTYTIKDADGDTETATFEVKLTDTKATFSLAPVNSSVDEEGLGGGNAGDSYASGDLPDQAVSVTSQALNINWGVDTPGTVFFNASQPGLTGLATSDGTPVNIAILGDGTLVGYTGASVPANTAAANVVFFATLSAAGSGSYSFTLKQALQHPTANTEDDKVLTIAITANDSENEGTSTTFTVTVDDDAPLANADTRTMDEQSTITGNVYGVTGAGAGDVADAIGADGPNASGPVISGKSVNLAGGTISVDADGEVITGQYGNLTLKSDGTYSYQAGSVSGGNKQDMFEYTVKDADGDTKTTTLTINVDDQINFVPDAVDDVNNTSSTPLDYQLMLILDFSGSMDETVSTPAGDKTRLEIARDSLISLLEQYKNSTTGTVSVKLIGFAEYTPFSATYLAGSNDAFATVDAAIAALMAVTPNQGDGNTDYDDALWLAKQGIDDPSWQSSVTGSLESKVYFVSDGRPTSSDTTSPFGGTGDGTNAVNDGEETIWQAALQAKGVQAIAVGVGADIAGDSSAIAQLGQVAYTPGGGSDTPVITVTDENQLTAALGSTAPAPINGFLLANDIVNPLDPLVSPKIFNLTLVDDADTNFVSQTFDANTWTIVTNNGTLVVDRTDGSYDYTPKAGSEGKSDSFIYTIKDTNGGDQDSATLTINIKAAPVITSDGGGVTAAVSVEEGTTLVTDVNATDIDSPTLTYSINGGADAGKFTIDSATGVLSFINAPDYENPTDAGGNNVYDVQVKVSDGNQSDLQSIAVTVTNKNDVAPTLAIGNIGTTYTVRDNFDSVAFNGNNGTKNWLGNWTESGDDNTAAGGDVRIESSGGNNFLVLDDNNDGDSSIQRSVDLTGASQATLEFDYSFSTSSTDESVRVQISTDGTNWTDLLVLTGNNSLGTTHFTADISAYISANTRIRILGDSGLESSDDSRFDNIQISYGLSATNYATTFTEGDAPVSIAALTSSVTDSDSTNMASAVVKLTNAFAGDALAVGGSNAANGTFGGINWVKTTVGSEIIVTFTGSATKVAYQSAIEAVTFSNSSLMPNTTLRNVEVTVNDGVANSNTATTTIAVVDVVTPPPPLPDGVEVPGSLPTDKAVPIATVPTTTAQQFFSNGNGSGTSANEWLTDNDGGGDASTLNGAAGNDRLEGNAGDDTLNGGSDNDYLDGGSGDDKMTGGTGNDTYLVGQSGDDVIESASQGTDIVFLSGNFNYTLADNVENLVQTGNGNSTLTGNTLGNEIYGGVGNNTINGGGGNDHIDGGAGTDTLNGDAGNDVLFGDTENDTLNGGADNDFLFGQAGNDTLNGGTGNDVLVGGIGNDTMDGGDGDDVFVGVEGVDLVNASIQGGVGTDLVDLSGLAVFNSAAAANIKNVEILSFEGGVNTNITLSYNDVISMTDSEHVLAIRGDASDNFSTAGWTSVASGVAGDGGRTYTVFQQNGVDGVATVYVESVI